MPTATPVNAVLGRWLQKHGHDDEPARLLELLCWRRSTATSRLPAVAAHRLPSRSHLSSCRTRRRWSTWRQRASRPSSGPTGYRRSYPWLSVDALGEDGEIAHRRGITDVPGLYALGLRFQHRRSSHFIAGVGEDARYLATQILARGADTRAAAAG
jgi:hypothetical protein